MAPSVAFSYSFLHSHSIFGEVAHSAASLPQFLDVRFITMGRAFCRPNYSQHNDSGQDKWHHQEAIISYSKIGALS